LDPKPASTASREGGKTVFCFRRDRIGLSNYFADLQNWIYQSVPFSGEQEESRTEDMLAVLMVDVDVVARRIINAEKRGRKLSKKTVFRLCGYDRSAMREVFRRLRLMAKKEQTLSKWLESQGKVE
jgi:hypothetical protein